MRAGVIQERMVNFIQEHSNYETSRSYLSMSKIGHCPFQQYSDFVYGMPASQDSHLGAFLGYSYERMVKDILIGAQVMRTAAGRELKAEWDERLRGHTDGETVDGDLIEIKSVNRHRFEIIEREGRALHDHFEQVQMYMHFGKYQHCEIVYVCREDLHIMVVHVSYQRQVAEELVSKAKYILDAIDRELPPHCNCGKCKAAR
jgi:hypothetical protein